MELINKFSKVAGYKINIHVSVAFLYSNNEIKESKKKKSLLTSCPKKMPPKTTKQNLGINLTKEVKDLHSENCKTLIKETEDD